MNKKKSNFDFDEHSLVRDHNIIILELFTITSLEPICDFSSSIRFEYSTLRATNTPIQFNFPRKTFK